MMRFRHVLAGALAVVLAACDTPERDRPAATPPQAGGSMDGAAGGPGGMHGMGGMGPMGGMMDSGMVGDMRQHMRAMMAASGDRMQAMLPRHRQMAANLLASMNREMREMNMAADARWTATVDSIREDLVRMPEMSAEELRASLPAHRDRLMRLTDLHQAMRIPDR